MNCPNCQNQIDEDSKFCQRCGFDLSKAKSDSNDVLERIDDLEDRISTIETYLSSFGSLKADTSKNVQDELYEEAVKVARKHEKVSASLLQRSLGVGYARAASLLDDLEEEGIIGNDDGSHERKVLK